MKSEHNRKFVCGGVALVIERMKNDLKQMPQDEVEKVIVESGILEKSPFLWITLIYRYGIKNDLKVEFKKINKTYGDLGVALELNTNILKWADQHNLALLKDIFMIAALEALLQVCDKYKLSKEAIALERAKYGNIPNTIEECEQWEH